MAAATVDTLPIGPSFGSSNEGSRDANHLENTNGSRSPGIVVLLDKNEEEEGVLVVVPVVQS
jgi:hypothetical protein